MWVCSVRESRFQLHKDENLPTDEARRPSVHESRCTAYCSGQQHIIAGGHLLHILRAPLLNDTLSITKLSRAGCPWLCGGDKSDNRIRTYACYLVAATSQNLVMALDVMAGLATAAVTMVASHW